MSSVSKKNVSFAGACRATPAAALVSRLRRLVRRRQKLLFIRRRRCSRLRGDARAVTVKTRGSEPRRDAIELGAVARCSIQTGGALLFAAAVSFAIDGASRASVDELSISHTACRLWSCYRAQRVSRLSAKLYRRAVRGLRRFRRKMPDRVGRALYSVRGYRQYAIKARGLRAAIRFRKKELRVNRRADGVYWHYSKRKSARRASAVAELGYWLGSRYFEAERLCTHVSGGDSDGRAWLCCRLVLKLSEASSRGVFFGLGLVALFNATQPFGGARWGRMRLSRLAPSAGAPAAAVYCRENAEYNTVLCVKKTTILD